MKDGLIMNIGLFVPMMFLFTETEKKQKKTKDKSSVRTSSNKKSEHK